MGRADEASQGASDHCNAGSACFGHGRHSAERSIDSELRGQVAGISTIRLATSKHRPERSGSRAGASEAAKRRGLPLALARSLAHCPLGI
jgi:hypothetical protein